MNGGPWARCRRPARAARPDDARAHVTELHRATRPGQDAREVENGDAFQWTVHAFGCLEIVMRSLSKAYAVCVRLPESWQIATRLRRSVSSTSVGVAGKSGEQTIVVARAARRARPRGRRCPAQRPPASDGVHSPGPSAPDRPAAPHAGACESSGVMRRRAGHSPARPSWLRHPSHRCRARHRPRRCRRPASGRERCRPCPSSIACDVVGRRVDDPLETRDAHRQRFAHQVEDRDPVHHRALEQEPHARGSRGCGELLACECDRSLVGRHHMAASGEAGTHVRDGGLPRRCPGSSSPPRP